MLDADSSVRSVAPTATVAEPQFRRPASRAVPADRVPHGPAGGVPFRRYSSRLADALTADRPDARAIRDAAERIQAIAAGLFRHAGNIEDAERARIAAAERRRKRLAALDAMRAAIRAGRPVQRAADALAPHYGLDPHALVSALRRDARRTTAAERRARDLEITRLARDGLRDRAIAERMTAAGHPISARRVSEIVRANLIEGLRG